MHEELKQVIKLHKEGKLHKKLLFNLSILVFITVVTLGILFYDIFWKDLNFLPAIGFAVFGFVLTFFFFIKMTRFVWDEEKEAVSIGRFDLTSFVIFAIFIVYRLSVNSFLEGYYANALEISGYSFATIFGGMLGRLCGTLIAIERTHKERK